MEYRVLRTIDPQSTLSHREPACGTLPGESARSSWTFRLIKTHHPRYSNAWLVEVCLEAHERSSDWTRHLTATLRFSEHSWFPPWWRHAGREPREPREVGGGRLEHGGAVSRQLHADSREPGVTVRRHVSPLFFEKCIVRILELWDFTRLDTNVDIAPVAWTIRRFDDRARDKTSGVPCKVSGDYSRRVNRCPVSPERNLHLWERASGGAEAGENAATRAEGGGVIY